MKSGQLRSALWSLFKQVIPLLKHVVLLSSTSGIDSPSTVWQAKEVGLAHALELVSVSPSPVDGESLLIQLVQHLFSEKKPNKGTKVETILYITYLFQNGAPRLTPDLCLRSLPLCKFVSWNLAAVTPGVSCYLSNWPPFLWVYRRDNTRWMLREHEKSTTS